MRPVDFITFGKTAGIGMMVPMACWLRTRCGKPFGPPQDYFRSHPAAAVLATWCHGLELRPSMWAGEPRGYRTRGKLAVGGGRSGIVIGLFKRGTWKVGIMGIISWDHPEEAEFFLAISGELFRVTCFNQLLILVILTLISEISTGIQCLPILWLCGFEPKRCC